MKKILIISYHSLPFDVIASYRANAYLKHLQSYGWSPTLLTHYIGMKNQKTVSKEEYEYGTIIRVPIKKSRIGRITSFLEKMILINKISILMRWMFGYLDARPEDIDSYFSLKTFCYKELEEIEQFDVLMGIFSPHHHLRLCYELNKRFKIPYVLDFRDLWDNRVMHIEYSPTILESLQDLLVQRHWKNWTKKALFFSIISDPYRSKLEDIIDVEGFVVMNGYDDESFVENPSLKQSSTFDIIYGGSLYEHQKLDIFLDGCLDFIKKIKPEKFQVKFIGSDRQLSVQSNLSGFMNAPKKRILNILPESYCLVSKRIPKKEILSIIQKSSMLLYLSMPDAPGTYLGKIFDYIGSKRNILMIPDDSGVVGELIRESGAGVICNTRREVSQKLSMAYNQWLKSGYLEFNGNEKVINSCTRKKQVEKFSMCLKNFVN